MMTGDQDKYRELKLFFALAVAGVVAALNHVEIPHTDALIDGRWVFGFMGFVLLGRWWTALALAALLSYPYGSPGIPVWVGFWGNMLYAVPCLLLIRPPAGRMVRRLGPGWRLGLGWLALVLACYQAFITPVVWAVIALLDGRPAVAGIIDGWRTQPLLVESVLVGLFSAATLVAVLAVTGLQAQRRRLEHINRILRGIRDVNQLIVREREREPLIEAAARILVSARGFRGAWIVLTDRLPDELQSAQAGLPDDAFREFAAQVKAGNLPLCCERARDGNCVVTVTDPGQACEDCSLAHVYGGVSGMGVCLTHGGRMFGCMGVSVPPEFANDEQEQSLLWEIAGDLAFALWVIETETQRETLTRKYAAVLSATSDAVLAVDPDGRITVFNPGAEKMFGCTADEALGTPIARFCPEDRQAEQAEKICRVLDTGTVAGYETERLTAAGRRIPVEITLGLNTDDQGRPQGISAILRDITERKQAEEALRESEGHLRSTLDGLSAHIAVLDKRGEIILTNKAYRDFGERNGVDPGAVFEGTNYLAVCDTASGEHSEEAGSFAEGIREVLSGKLPSFELEYPCHSPEEKRWFVGRVTPTQGDGPGRVVIAHENISERKQAEDALNRKHEMLVRTEATAHVGSWEWEAEGDKVNWSDELFRIFGLEPADEAPPFAEHQAFYVMEDRARLARAVDECVTTGAPYDLEVRVTRSDGALRHCVVRGFPGRDADGAVKRLYGSLQDITEIRRAEEHVTTLSHMLDDAPASITIHDTEGRFIFVNAATVSLHGYESMEEFMEIDLHELDVPESEALLAERLRKIAEEGEARFEVEHYRKDGSTFPLAVLAKRIDWEGRPAILSIAADITERRQAETLIAASEKKFRHAFMTSPDSININRMFDGRYIEVNDGFLRIMGYKREEVIGRTSLELNIWKNLEDRQALVKGLQADRYVENLSAQFYRADGTIREGLMSASVMELNGEQCILSITRDVTEGKQAEETLIRQQRSIKLTNRIANIFLTSSRNEVFADVLDVLLMALDSRFGYFGYIDEAGDLVCPSLTRDVWDQCQVAEKSIVFSRAGWGGLWGRSLLEKQTLIANENLRIPEGHVTLENALATPIVYNDNLIGQFVVANKAGGYDKDDRDLMENAAAQTAPILFAIREEARQKAAHEKLEEQLRQSQKMEAVGQLAGGIAHDFNNILVPIIGYAELGMMGLSPNDKLYANLQHIHRAAERAATLTRQILAFSRKQMLEMKSLNLNEVVTNFEKMLRRLIGENIALKVILSPSLALVQADPAQIEQILMNLAINARDAMPHGGKLTIETDNLFLDKRYAQMHIEVQPGPYVMLAVSDTGTGMDAETKEHIFEPFFTTKPQGAGTGLGLATVFGIVKQHQGYVWVYSEPGQGTTFKVYLPQADRPEPDIAAPAQPDSLYGAETILLVEDEAMVRKLACETLTAHGYTVLEAQSPADALRLTADYQDTIDLLLTDVIMPEMNGRQLYEKVAAIRPEISVLYMSGYTDNVIVHHGVLNQDVDFLQKPFTVHRLTQKVREVLR